MPFAANGEGGADRIAGLADLRLNGGGVESGPDTVVAVLEAKANGF